MFDHPVTRSQISAIDAALSESLAHHAGGTPEGLALLARAMGYSLTNGGKRLRPLLTLKVAAMFDCSAEKAMPAALAGEFIHAYSLVHDDLPAMDDSDLRRGQPSVHKAFDEATAILAGDALQTAAFAILADAPLPQGARLDLVRELSHASGALGMAGGQMLDILAEQERPGNTDITLLQSLKTGALIRYACLAGGIAAGAGEGDLGRIGTYAEKIGLTFQITDDILDATAHPDDLGKPAGQDAERGKETFVVLLGIGGAREKARCLTEEAVAALTPFGEKAADLESLARFIIEREM